MIDALEDIATLGGLTLVLVHIWSLFYYLVVDVWRICGGLFWHEGLIIHGELVLAWRLNYISALVLEDYISALVLEDYISALVF